MRKLLFRTYLLIFSMLIFWPGSSYAQDEFEQAITEPVVGFKEAIVKLAPAAFIAIFLVSAMFNIAKIFGRDAEWRQFFVGVGLYMLAMSAVVAIIAIIGTLRFG